MVKTLNVPMDDLEYERLLQKKGDMSWHDFLMLLMSIDLKKAKLDDKKGV